MIVHTLFTRFFLNMAFHKNFFCLIIIFCAHYTHATSGNRERDPCRVVCEEFSASRRGDGEFLCDTGSSTCVRSPWGDAHYCLHLYWGASDDGLPGLIYEENEGQLTPDELENYLTCGQAREIVGNLVHQPPPVLTDFSHVNAMTEIICRLRPVERELARAANGRDRLTAAQHLERHALFREVMHRPGARVVPWEIPLTPYDGLELLSRVYGDSIGLLFEHRRAIRARCQHCGIPSNTVNSSSPVYRIPLRLNPYVSEMNVTIALHESFTSQNEPSSLCQTCSSSTMISTGTILTKLPEILPIEFRRQLYHLGPFMNTRVIFPRTLDLSSIPGVAELNTSTTHYTLVALTHTHANGSHSAELLHNRTWYLVDTNGDIHFAEPTIDSSSTVSLLLYQRDDVE